MSVPGHDGNGTEFPSIDVVWTPQWYEKAKEYWSAQDASINGVLGGYGNLHPVDVSGSESFLLQATRGVGNEVAADCGAGVGRIAQFVLAKRFAKIDLIEPCEKLLVQAKIDLAKTVFPSTTEVSFVCAPLQEWKPAKAHYDLLWHQWVLLYLTDVDCVAYLVRCRESLKPNGVICVKENVSMADGQFLLDVDDNSVTRTLEQYLGIFEKAGLRVKLQMRQPRWPAHLFPVLMFALVATT